MNQQDQFNNYSFNYYNYSNNGINNVSTSPFDYSTYNQPTSPTSQNYSWSTYQYNYPNYTDYNNYQSVYYNQFKNASVSSSNNSFTSYDYNSNHSDESSPNTLAAHNSTNQFVYNNISLDTKSTNESPVSQSSKQSTSARKYFESTPLVNQTPKVRVTKSSIRHYQLPDKAVEIMNDWFLEHLNNPYPQQTEKEHLAKLGGISVKQVTAWFSNRRNRSQNTKPKRMKRVLEQEINNIFSEFVTDQVSKDVIIEKLRSTLVDHEINQS